MGLFSQAFQVKYCLIKNVYNKISNYVSPFQAGSQRNRGTNHVSIKRGDRSLFIHQNKIVNVYTEKFKINAKRSINALSRLSTKKPINIKQMLCKFNCKLDDTMPSFDICCVNIATQFYKKTNKLFL